MNPKKNLILLHGALGSLDQFKSLKNLLSESFQIHTFNFEGHGGRPSNGTYSMSRFAENILEFMTENGIEKADFFGYSMGGYVALIFAKKHPEKAGKIMTLGTKFDWTPESSAKEVKMLNPEKIEEKVPKFAQMLKARHAPLDWKMVLNNTAEMMVNLGNGEAWKPKDFRDIQNEVLISLGSDDHMVSEAESRLISENLLNGIFKKIEGFPHPIEKVDSERLSEISREFFN